MFAAMYRKFGAALNYLNSLYRLASPLRKLECIPTNEEIISSLYVSCFGISNYPVTLYGKIYRTELITGASEYEPVVKFMGDDLSITLRALPETKRLVIIPDIVYNYRIGGLTSKFQSDMLDDFLRLYRFKKKMALRYPMPQNIDYLMAVELKNIVLSWLETCIINGRYDSEMIRNEMIRVCRLPEIREAICQKDFIQEEPEGMRKAIEEANIDVIDAYLKERVHTGRIRRIIRSVLK